MMALNAEPKKYGGSECQTVKRWWLWMPRYEEMMRENMPQCDVSPQLSIHWNGLKETLWVSKDALLTSQDGQINYKIKSHNPSY